jgi:hypothetical protein
MRKEQKQKLRDFVVGTTSRVILLLLFVGLGVTYVVQTSLISTKGYDIDSLRREVASLEKEDRQVQIQIAEYRSLQRVAEKVQNLGMVPAGDVQYLYPVGSSVAKR